MNRFTRNNLSLIVIIACACVAAVVLLVFSIIRYVGMRACMAEVATIKKKVDDLSRKNPSPHNDNRAPIETNTANFTAAADKLAVYFTPRMKAVAEEFVKGLIETPVNNPEKDENGKVIPLTVEKFRRDYEAMWNKGKNNVDKNYNYNNFKELHFANWKSQVRICLPKAQALTTEPLSEDTLPEMLFSYIGIPRVMGEQPDQIIGFMKNYQTALVRMMTSVRFNTELKRVDWFGFDPEDISSPAKFSMKFNSPRDHYPQIARIWEIYGDVIKRMTGCSMMVSFKDRNGKNCVLPFNKDVTSKLDEEKIPYTTFDDKIDSFHGLELRGAMGPAASNPEAVRSAIAGNEEGSFRIYRMRLSVGGTMAGIRTLVKALEEGYLEHHIYVIRSIALKAERDGAHEVLAARGMVASPANEKKQTQTNTTSRRRGRGRAAVSDSSQEQQQTVDPAVLEEQKRREEEALNKLKFYDRPGYGLVLIGDDNTCKAVIDFDCYQLK